MTRENFLSLLLDTRRTVTHKTGAVQTATLALSDELKKLFDIWEKVCISRWNLFGLDIHPRSLEVNTAKNILLDPKPIVTFSSRHFGQHRSRSFSQMLQHIKLPSEVYSLALAAGRANTIKPLFQVLWASLSPLLSQNARRKLCTALFISVIIAEDMPITHEDYTKIFGNLSNFFAIDLPAVHLYLSVIFHNTFLCETYITFPHVCGKASQGLSNCSCPLTDALVKNFVQDFHDNVNLFPVEFIFIIGVFRLKLRKSIQDKIVLYLSCTKLLVISLLGLPLRTSQWIGFIGESKGSAMAYSCVQCFSEEILRISGAIPPHVSACAPDHERSTLTEKLKRDFSTIFSAADEIVKQILSSKKPPESTDADDMTFLLQGVCDMFDAALEPNASEATKIRKLKRLSLLEPPCFVISVTGRHLLVEAVKRLLSSSPDSKLGPLLSLLSSYDPPPVNTKPASDKISQSAGTRKANCLQEVDSDNWMAGDESLLIFRLHNTAHLVVDPPSSDSQHLLEEASLLDQQSRIEGEVEECPGRAGVLFDSTLDFSDQEDAEMEEFETFESWLLRAFGRARNRVVPLDEVHTAAAGAGTASANFSSLASAASTSSSSNSSSSSSSSSAPSDNVGAAVSVSMIHPPSPCCSPSCRGRGLELRIGEEEVTMREPERKPAGHVVGGGGGGGEAPVVSTSQHESVRFSAPDGLVNGADEQMLSGKRTRFSLLSACSHTGQELEDNALEYADRTSVVVAVSDKASSLRSEDLRSTDLDLYVPPERRRVCSLDIAESEEIAESSFSCASPASGPISLSHSLPRSDLDEEAEEEEEALFAGRRHLSVGSQEPPVHNASLSSAKREGMLLPLPTTIRRQHETVRRLVDFSSGGGDRIRCRSHSQEAPSGTAAAAAASNRPPTHAVWTQSSRVRSYLLQERGTDFSPQFPRLARSRSATSLNVRDDIDNKRATAVAAAGTEETATFNPRVIFRRISAPSPPAPKLRTGGAVTAAEPWLAAAAATAHPLPGAASASSYVQMGLPRPDSMIPTTSGSWTVNLASNAPDSSAASLGVTEEREGEEEEEEEEDGVDSVIEEEEDDDNDGDVLSDHHSPSVNLSGRVSPSITSGGRVSPLSTVSGGGLRNYPLAAVCVRPSQGGGGGIFSTLNNVNPQSSLSSYFATAANLLRRAEEVSDVTEKFGKFDLPHHARSNEHETWSMASEAWSTDVLASDTESINRGGASIGGGASSTAQSSIPTLPSISVSASAMVASNSAAICHPNAPFRPGLHTRCQQTSSPTQRLLTASTGTNSSFQPPSASNRLRRRRRRHHHHHHYHQFGNHAHVGGGGGGGLPESQRPFEGSPNSSSGRCRYQQHQRNRTLSPLVQSSHPLLATPAEGLAGLSASSPVPPASQLATSPATTTPRSVSCYDAVRSDDQPPAEGYHDQRHAQLRKEGREAAHPHLHAGTNMPYTNSDRRMSARRGGGCPKSADHPEASGSREPEDVGRGEPYPSTSRSKPRTSFLLPSEREPALNYRDASSFPSSSGAWAAFSMTSSGPDQNHLPFSSANAVDSEIAPTAGVYRRLLNCASRRLLNLLQSQHAPQVISSLMAQQISPLSAPNRSVGTVEDITLRTFLVALREHAFQLQDVSLAWQAQDTLHLFRALQCHWPQYHQTAADDISASDTHSAACCASSSPPRSPPSSTSRGRGASGRRRRPRRSVPDGGASGSTAAAAAARNPQSPSRSAGTTAAAELPASSLASCLTDCVQRESRRQENLLDWLEASKFTVSQRLADLEFLQRSSKRQLTALRNEVLSRLADEYLAEESVALAQFRDRVSSELEHLSQADGDVGSHRECQATATSEPHTARILRHLTNFLDHARPRLLARLAAVPGTAAAASSVTAAEVLVTIERILMRDLFVFLCTRCPTSLCEAPSADRKFTDMLAQRRKLASTWLRGLPERYLILAPFTMAQTELRLINTNYRPIDKMECLKRVLEGISPSDAQSQLPPSPDPRIVSILAYVIIQANPPCFLLNLHFIENFGAQLLHTEPVEVYCRVWRHVKAAVVQLRGGVGPS